MCILTMKYLSSVWFLAHKRFRLINATYSDIWILQIYLACCLQTCLKSTGCLLYLEVIFKTGFHCLVFCWFFFYWSRQPGRLGDLVLAQRMNKPEDYYCFSHSALVQCEGKTRVILCFVNYYVYHEIFIYLLYQLWDEYLILMLCSPIAYQGYSRDKQNPMTLLRVNLCYSPMSYSDVLLNLIFTLPLQSLSFCCSVQTICH